MNEGTKRERERIVAIPFPFPRDTLKRFFFVRDSSRHRGITSFPLAGSPARDVLLVPANLILKPRIRVAEYDEKRKEEGKRRKSANFSFYGSTWERSHRPLRGICQMIIGISVTLAEGCALLSHAIFTDSLFYVSYEARISCSVGSRRRRSSPRDVS